LHRPVFFYKKDKYKDDPEEETEERYRALFAPSEE